MPSSLPFLPRARHALYKAAAPVAAILTVAACSPAVSIENADVPQWRATALPAAPGTVLEDAGKILNRDRIIREAADVPAGRYILSATCEGGGKAFFAVSLNGVQVVDAGAACNGSRETTRIMLDEPGAVEISTSSVDAPLIYAYHLVPAE
ncbi:hypothetical protein [Arthrobacter sp. AD-310]